MHLAFDTNDLTQRDALCLMALLENIAGVEVPLGIAPKEATRAVSCFEPEAAPAGATRIVQPETAEKPKRGRPRKEQAAGVPEIHPTDASGAAGPTPSDEPTATNAVGAENEPISMDDLRDSVNDHVSRNGMPSAQMVFKEFGCQRANEIMALEPAQQHAFLAKMKK